MKLINLFSLRCRLPLILAVVALLASPGSAVDLPGMSTVTELLLKYDSNGDGALDKSEFQAALSSSFDEIDKDGDNKITEAEIEGLASPIGEEYGVIAATAAVFTIKTILFTLDKNGDRVLSRVEYEEGCTAYFIRLDANRNGSLSKDEIMKWPAQMFSARNASDSQAKPAAGEPPITLWPQGTPGALGKTAKDIPTLTPHLPAKANGAAMVLIPGGSYSGIYEGQGDPFARWLNEQGITVFVLRYRLGSAGYRYPAQLQDAVQAMRHVRKNAAQWKIAPNRIGVMGFSAGGHLVSTLINRPEDGDVASTDNADRVSPRPDLAILCYPVISMITKPHAASRRNLIGASPDDELVRKTSSELQVHAGLPPCFVWHTGEDKMVPVDHSLLFAAALQRHGVPHELHIYQRGDHGTGLMGTVHPWMGDLLFWLHAQGFK